jgi:hypothetical protein
MTITDLSKRGSPIPGIATRSLPAKVSLMGAIVSCLALSRKRALASEAPLA